MFERVFRNLLLILAIAWIAPGVSSGQITPELIEAAKKEGEVMFYGAITVNSSKAIGDAFEKKYGIKLRHWRGDATELTAAMRAAASRGAGTMIICDAETDDDLARIAMAARAAQPGFYAGTAGLAQALAGMSGALGRRAIELPATRRGTLIAVGTPAKVTREAARKLADHLGRPPVRVCVDGEAHIDESTPGNATLSGSATRILAGGDELVLLDSARTDAVAVNPEFAETFARALREALPHAGALIASGGETAAALLGQVGVHGITLLDELEPGLALGITRGDVEVPIVTKPGAFGDAESLVRCLARLHQLQGRE